MYDTENQRTRDPSADTCFLNCSNYDLPDPEIANEVSNATARAMPENNASNPAAKPSSKVFNSTGAAPDVARLKNPIASYQRDKDKAITILPSAEEDDSKNTEQSFHIPVNCGNSSDSMLVTSTPPQSVYSIASNPPTLPSGEIIDSKNTLQSFKIRSSAPLTNRSPSETNNVAVSSILPNAYPATVWIPQSLAYDGDVPAPETVYVAELVTSTNPRQSATRFRMAFRFFALVGVISILYAVYRLVTVFFFA
jgi:hypothetical protein